MSEFISNSWTEEVQSGINVDNSWRAISTLASDSNVQSGSQFYTTPTLQSSNEINTSFTTPLLKTQSQIDGESSSSSLPSWNITSTYVYPSVLATSNIELNTNLASRTTYITQEALPFVDSSKKYANIVASLIRNEQYDDLFSNEIVKFSADATKGLFGYLTEMVSKQAVSDKYYVEAIAEKAGGPFFLTGSKEYRTPGNCYIIRLANDSNVDLPKRITKLLTSFDGTIKYSYQNGVSGFAVCFPDAQLPLILLKAISGLQWLEREQYMSPNQVQEAAPWQLARLSSPTEKLSEQMQYTFNATGNGVNVYVIDSGALLSHPEFTGRAKIAYSVFADAPEDCAGHGTQVSSLIGGVNVGVAKRSNLLLLQVLDCDGQGENSSVLQALDWVIQNHAKPAVINMSVGGPKSKAVDEAVQAAIDAGIAVVVAAGNSQIDACLNSPSGVASAMVVGASTFDLKRAPFSNYGTCVELFAPGSHVVAAAIESQATTILKNSFGYTFVSGTSLSAPLVTGLYALLLEVNPDASPSVLKAAVLEASTRGILDSSSLVGSPNLVASMPNLKDMGMVPFGFLPPGTLPYLLPTSNSGTVELILIILALCLVFIFSLVAVVLIYKRRQKRRMRETMKLPSAFQ